jgi:hypothetical protein
LDLTDREYLQLHPLQAVAVVGHLNDAAALLQQQG